MSAPSRYFALLGPLAYTVVWLFVLPVVAEVGAALAILSLTLVTGLYCFVVARAKGRNEILWSIFGAVAGFVELGLIPVVIISVLSAKSSAEGNADKRSFSRAT